MGGEMALVFKRASRAALLGCCGIAAMATAARAATDSAAPQMEEVVVTAQRTEQKLQKVPVAVTVFNNAALQQKGIVTVEDLEYHTPNFNFILMPSINAPSISIRGIGGFADTFAQDAPIGTYVDDVYIARGDDFGQQFYDLQDVQVLRGPQGTLFGKDTPGGAVLVDTKNPDPTYGGYFDVGVGGGGYGLGSGANRSIYHLEGAINVPISPILGIRIAAFHDNDDGYAVSNFNGHRFYSRDDGAERATIMFKPNDKFEARLVLDHHTVDDGGPAYIDLGFTPSGADVQPYDELHGGTAAQNNLVALGQHPNPYVNGSGNTKQDGITGSGSSATLRLTYSFSDDWSLRSITGWRQTAHDTVSNSDSGGEFAAGALADDLRQEQVSQEFVLTGKITDKLRTTSGLFFFQETGQESTREPTVLSLGPSTPPYTFFDPLNFAATNVKNISEAAFVNVSYDILPNLTASFGFRYSYDDKTSNLDTEYLGGTLNPLLGGGAVPPTVLTKGPTKESAGQPLYDAKLTWQATPDLLFYLKYGTGYRAGGNSFFTFSTVNASFGPETSYTYEAGAKWSFNIGSVPGRLNTAIFYTGYKDFQNSVIVATPTAVEFYIANAGAAEYKGAEFELTIKPTNQLDLSASLGLLDATYTNYILGGANYDGLPIPATPDENFSLSANYTIPSNVGDWLLHADYSITSSYNITDTFAPNSPIVSNRTNLYTQPVLNIVNLRLTLHQAFGSKVDVSLWTKNLLDETNLISIFPTAQEQEAIYGSPRTFGIELRAAF
jgi:iron complex outermembrane receptor protein